MTTQGQDPAPPGPAPGALADRARGRVTLWLGPLLALGVWLLPLPLPDEAHRLAAVMALVVTWWIGEPVPPAVTALLGPTLAMLLGALPAAVPARDAAKVAFKGFGDPILMLFMGGFFIAEALTVHGLDRRFAMRVLAIPAVGASPARVVAGLGIVACALSMWVSNTATTALLIPIARGVLRLMHGKDGAPPGRLDAVCMLMLPFAATVGGLGTPVGTAPNLIGMAELERAGHGVSFLSWMAITLPLVLAMMVALVLLLGRDLPRGQVGFHLHAQEELRRIGPWRRGEVITAVAFGLAVLGWIGTGVVNLLGSRFPAAEAWCEGHLSEGGIGLLAAALLFLVPTERGRPTLTWPEAARIDWGTLLLLGGGLSLGGLVKDTGLAEAIGKGVVQGLGVSSTWALVAVSAFLAIALSELSSNTATATLLVPTVIGIANTAGVSPVPPALAATIGCSFGFMLPISTPPNALAYATGLVPITTMVRRGAVFDLIGFALIVAGILLLLPWLGPDLPGAVR